MASALPTRVTQAMNPRSLLRYAAFAVAGLLLVIVALGGYIAATFDPNDYKDEVAALVKRSKGRDLAIEGAVRLSYWPNLAADLSDVKLSEAGGKGDFVTVERVRASVAVMPLLGRRVVVNGVDVTGLRASIRRDADGRFNFADLLSKPEEKSEKVDFDIASVKVRDGRIDYADAAGTRLTLDGIQVKTGAISANAARDVEVAARLADPKQPAQLRLKLARADFADALSASGLAIKASSNGPAGKVDAEVDLEQLTQQGEAFAGKGLKAQINGEMAGKRIDATSALDRLELRGGAVSGQGVTVQAKVDGPDTQLDIRAAAARIDQQGRTLSSSPLQATVSGKAAGTSLDLKLASPLTLDLAQQRLGLRAVDLQFSAKQQLVDLNGRLKGPADFALASQTLRLPGFSLDLTAASPKLAGGPVAVRLDGDLDAGLAARRADLRFDGKVDGHAVAGIVGAEAAGAPALRADLKARDVDIARVIARFSKSDLLSGRGDLDLKVNTRGDSAEALTKALNGSGAVALRDGAVKGLDINSSIREVRSAVRKALGKESGTTVKTKKTDFSEMTATFAIRDGVLDNRDLALKSPLLRVAGAGTIDLVKGELDYGVKASVVATREGQGGAERAQLAGVTVPVKLFGPLAAPQYSIDFAAMLTPDTLQKALADPGAAREAAKETVRDAKEQVKALKDGVRDLKGLFGR
ncbi:MAG: AsmA family protein [Rhodocyclaceae bacterium]|nr:AsmA family protein [Rhodocyclaceae bacterium]